MLLFLYCIWLICNGHITLEICLFGVLVSGAVFLFTVKYLDYSIQKELLFYKSVPYLMAYVFWLLIEICKANIAVTKLIFRRKKVEPVRVTFHVPLHTQFTRVLFANSITLTPGTITAELNGNEYLVHCLSKELVDGIDDSRILRILIKMEGMYQNGNCRN